MSNKVKPVAGVYGRLTVVARHGTDENGNAMWLCKCECGNEKVARGNSLREGHVVSCGCYNAERIAGSRFKVGDRWPQQGKVDVKALMRRELKGKYE